MEQLQTVNIEPSGSYLMPVLTGNDGDNREGHASQGMRHYRSADTPLIFAKKYAPSIVMADGQKITSR